MTHDPDPYADLDYRADAGELSEEFRKPVRVLLARRPTKPARHRPARNSV
ncbi:hypothetical protein [Devosia aurantiaca]|uniref:Uncharacterized protein n=1 Tax=Devosia aurantiaca TaxID=2714858 RepID=A0A6M1ST09_9HYPH|nr:hypothetical protein [Devosia aurantiaca]NGP17543.1 hypothetical protein [Devosia aurantiaca]